MRMTKKGPIILLRQNVLLYGAYIALFLGRQRKGQWLKRKRSPSYNSLPIFSDKKTSKISNQITENWEIFSLSYFNRHLRITSAYILIKTARVRVTFEIGAVFVFYRKSRTIAENFSKKMLLTKLFAFHRTNAIKGYFVKIFSWSSNN